MSINIVNAFYSALTGSAALTATLIGSRIYLIEGPHNSTLPYLVVSPVFTFVEPWYSSVDAKELPFQIDLWALRTTGMTALAAANTALYTLLHRSRLTVTGHDGAVITCTNEGSYSTSEDACRIRSEWLAESAKLP